MVAEPVPQTELGAQKAEIALGFKQAPMVEPIRHKHVRRRLRVIKTSAQPGPSCWRNSYLARIGEVRGRNSRTGSLVHALGKRQHHGGRGGAVDSRNCRPGRLWPGEGGPR